MDILPNLKKRKGGRIKTEFCGRAHPRYLVHPLLAKVYFTGRSYIWSIYMSNKRAPRVTPKLVRRNNFRPRYRPMKTKTRTKLIFGVKNSIMQMIAHSKLPPNKINAIATKINAICLDLSKL